ncbi:MAG: hypothetical protein A2408_02770 [Candidatus Yonathbacteria bacterium RIFOXYC1_FULL_52_10]|uniref:DUF378 domain-containing protein n=1 Tax=Candidatus Yonathbacteria bacterium RIFOXYD1_FULL_52_36 TaxID=1802730 RepID=A0A1G2SKA2_9BACT|nr:MAG: hypothetical protein A2408_02770 [Candidatus Yonathbacteria bacterium RIFOXYC1_FULL_52_10]OHA85029.1 MAG: hypothetical protein A2591_02310 [Candidatus Yonathbacteria bacterium RIFOXYD1_FULL_52_36]
MKALHMIAFILLIVGGLNWALTAFGWNVVEMLSGGEMGTFAKTVYVLVGLAALYEVATHKSTCRVCGAGSSM